MAEPYKPIYPGNWDQLNEYIAELTSSSDIDTILASVAKVEYHGFGGTRQPPLEGGWRNYSPSYAPARYRLNANSNIALQGLICRTDPLTEQTPILTMPPGARPDQALIFMAASASSVSRIDVHPDGSVLWFEHLAGDGAHTYLSLSGIGYSVAPPLGPTQLPAPA